MARLCCEINTFIWLKKGFYLMHLLPKKTMTIIVLFYFDMLTQPLVKYERPVYVAFFIVVGQKMA